jgi:phage terminase large subunit-like protein
MLAEHSLAESLASLSEKERTEALASLSNEQCLALLYDWKFWARPKQFIPDDAMPSGVRWAVWLILAGRGFGKTRTGAEWVRDSVKRGCGHIALMGPTVGDVRAVMVEGESGLLACSWQHDFDFKGNWIGRPEYEPSKRRLTWKNGARAYTYSAEEPDSMRGPQHDAGWADEIAAWYDPQAMWDMYQFGLRLGEYPRTCVTTTPRPLPIIRELLKDPTTHVTSGSTFENAANVAPKFLETIRKKYAGTRLGRQEINAEVLDDIPGALWTRAMLNRARHGTQGQKLTEFNIPQMVRVVVSVDPSGTKGIPGQTATAKKRAEAMQNGPNDVGIVVVGLGVDGLAYVLADETCNLAPNDWARVVADAFHYWSADRIVGETNYGGALVESNIRAHDPMLPFKEVTASRGKSVRAEPVASLYEQDRVKHVAKVKDDFDSLLQLEDQLCLFASDGYKGKGSPDRGDALVWAITELMLDETAYNLHALV